MDLSSREGHDAAIVSLFLGFMYKWQCCSTASAVRAYSTGSQPCAWSTSCPVYFTVPSGFSDIAIAEIIGKSNKLHDIRSLLFFHKYSRFFLRFWPRRIM